MFLDGIDDVVTVIRARGRYRKRNRNRRTHEHHGELHVVLLWNSGRDWLRTRDMKVQQLPPKHQFADVSRTLARSTQHKALAKWNTIRRLAIMRFSRDHPTMHVFE